jgi:hypothetical protein
MPWDIFVTRPKSEKNGNEKLEQQGIENCCPVNI